MCNSDKLKNAHWQLFVQFRQIKNAHWQLFVPFEQTCAFICVISVCICGNGMKSCRKTAKTHKKYTHTLICHNFTGFKDYDVSLGSVDVSNSILS